MSDKVSTIPSYDSAKESLQNYLSFLMNESEGFSDSGGSIEEKDRKRKKYHDSIMEAFGVEPSNSYMRDKYFGFPNLDSRLKAYEDDLSGLSMYYYCVIVDTMTDGLSYRGDIVTKYGVKLRIPHILKHLKENWSEAYRICRRNVDEEWKMVESYNKYIDATVDEKARYDKKCFTSYSHELNAAESMYMTAIKKLEKVNLQPMEFFTEPNVAEYVTKPENMVSSAICKLSVNDLKCRAFMDKFKSGGYKNRWNYSKFVSWRDSQQSSTEESSKGA